MPSGILSLEHMMDRAEGWIELDRMLAHSRHSLSKIFRAVLNVATVGLIIHVLRRPWKWSHSRVRNPSEASTECKQG